MDIESLLRSLNAHSVEYVLIGATAFPVHGYARATLDVDIFIRPTPENARRTHQALAAFGYDLSSVTDEELLTKKILIRQYLVEADIHPFVGGATFENARVVSALCGPWPFLQAARPPRRLTPRHATRRPARASPGRRLASATAWASRRRRLTDRALGSPRRAASCVLVGRARH